MSRSVFQKNYKKHKEFLANYSNEIRLFSKALILDIVGHEGRYATPYLQEEYRGGIYFVCAVEKNSNILAVRLNGLSYSDLRSNYGSNSNIIGREVVLITKSFSDTDLENSTISFLDEAYGNIDYQDDSISSIPVSMGAIAGLSYRMEDRMFYNKNLQTNPGEIWGEIRPLWIQEAALKLEYLNLSTTIFAMQQL